jgi:acyl-CoA oxidase
VGDLGNFGNHALVSAQLIIKGKKFGVHSFLVPIRDKEHKVLPNVEVGDIGPKFGYQTKDNGYALFNKHRIPRMNMLMRYTKVSPTGEYTKTGDEKISYATMLMIRSMIPDSCCLAYSKAALIATRYSLVRSQFRDSKKN